MASLDWQVPLDLPRDICLLAVATSGGSAERGSAEGEAAGERSVRGEAPKGGPAASGGAVDSRSRPIPPAATLPVGAPQTGGRGSGVPSVAGDPGDPNDASDPATPADPADPADLVANDGRWGCKNVTVLEAGRGRVLRLELRGDVSGGPFALAAEGWVAELTAGLVLPRGLAGLARGAGLGAGRVPEGWRAGLVQLVREEPALAERLDLGAVVPVAGGRRDPGLEVWLEGMELDPDRAEPFLVLLREPPAAGRGCLLLLDSGGGVVGGHTLQVAR